MARSETATQGVAPTTPPPAPAGPPSARGYLYRRHSLAVRISHWINVVALTVLLMSGLMIFGAHPSLDWGRQSYSGRPSLLTIEARDAGGGRLVGTTTVLGHDFDTTGWLGVSTGPDGTPSQVAFPHWATIPGSYSLSEGRLWHFFFTWVLVVNGLLYLLHGLASRHLRRDLWPTGADWRGMGLSIVDHLMFRHPQGEAARRYNVLQKGRSRLPVVRRHLRRRRRARPR